MIINKEEEPKSLVLPELELIIARNTTNAATINKPYSAIHVRTSPTGEEQNRTRHILQVQDQSGGE